MPFDEDKVRASNMFLPHPDPGLRSFPFALLVPSSLPLPNFTDLMDPLDQLDFDADGDVPGMFDYKEQPHEQTCLVSDLERASAENDVPAVEHTLRMLRYNQASPRLLSKPGSALQIAIDNGHVEVVQRLLSSGVQISAVHVRSATLSRVKEIIQLLLQYGWPINAALGWSDPPALAYAVEDLGLTTWFLAHGADPNASCRLDKTPLSAAVQYGHTDVIQTLFACGGSVRQGQLLHFAIWRERPDRLAVVDYIIQQGAPINALMYHQHPSSFKQRERFGLGTPLHDAAAMGDLGIVQTLLAHNASILSKDTRGQFPFQRAEANGHDVIARLLRPTIR